MTESLHEPPALIWRTWAMPTPDTFSIPAIARLLDRWLRGCAIVVDPFARNSTIGSHRNDLNPNTAANYHMEARDFLRHLRDEGLIADAVLFDPPYSPRQISEVYQQVGRPCATEDTQNARLYRECRDLLTDLLCPGGVAVSCGWNSGGFGKDRRFVQRELLMVAHGGAHNDTIVTVETFNVRIGNRAARSAQTAASLDIETAPSEGGLFSGQ